MRLRCCYVFVLMLAVEVTAAEVSESSSYRCATELAARRSLVRSVVARMRVVIRDEKLGQQYELNGASVADASGNSRLRLTANSGQLLFDCSLHDSQVEAFVPARDILYSGGREALLREAPPNLYFVLRCGNALDLFFPCLALDPGHAREARIGTRILCDLVHGTAPLARLERLEVGHDPQFGPVVRSLRLFGPGGIGEGRVDFSDYAQAGSGPATPRKMILRPPGSRYVIEFQAEDVTLDLSIAPAKFILAAPAHVRRVKFTEALHTDFKLLD